jgi:hypothetical protein
LLISVYSFIIKKREIEEVVTKERDRRNRRKG